MTSEEIDLAIAGIEKSLRSSFFKLPGVGLGVSAVAGILTPFMGIGMGVAAASAGVAAIAGAAQGHNAKKHFEEQRALLIWREWVSRAAKDDAGRQFEGVITMRADIEALYEQEPRGTHFPLKQAFRLIDVYTRQLQRIEIVDLKFISLTNVQAELLEKQAQLQRLGEMSQSADKTLQKIEAEIAQLKNLSTQLNAACERLENLLVSVRRELQVKQLKNEIEDLSSIVSQDSNSAKEPTAQGQDLVELERQITREVETFIQLERESDLHLRDL